LPEGACWNVGKLTRRYVPQDRGGIKNDDVVFRKVIRLAKRL
jgi:hypothetical protein